MDYSDSYVDEYGKKYILTCHKKVFEEVPEPKKGNQSMEDYDYDNYTPQDYDVYDDSFHCSENRKKIYEVDKVVGIGSGNTLVEVCIPVCPPAVEVLSCLSSEKVKFDVLKAKKGKVFINGRLLKSIPYRIKCSPWHPEHGCCFGSFTADTKCAVAEVPFILCINVPGAKEGHKVIVLDYDVNAVNIPDYSCGCLIKSITEKDCISVKVKVVKPEIIRIGHDDCGC